jgi:hypothetical protein
MGRRKDLKLYFDKHRLNAYANDIFLGFPFGAMFAIPPHAATVDHLERKYSKDDIFCDELRYAKSRETHCDGDGYCDHC